MIGEEAGHERAGGGVAGEEPVEVTANDLTARVLVVADQEPHGGVQDVVQARGDQEAVRCAVNAAAHNGIGSNCFTDPVEAGVEQGVHECHQDTDHKTGDRCQDGNEPAPVEEPEIIGKLRSIEPLPQDRRQQAHHDTGEHTVVDQGLIPVRVRLPFEDDRRHRLEHAVDHHVADDGCQGSRSVGLLGPADRDTDGEDQRQPREDCLSCRRDHCSSTVHRTESPEQVVLAEAEQDSRSRQNGDRKHQASAEALNPGEHFRFLLRGVFESHQGPSSFAGPRRDRPLVLEIRVSYTCRFRENAGHGSCSEVRPKPFCRNCCGAGLPTGTVRS